MSVWVEEKWGGSIYLHHIFFICLFSEDGERHMISGNITFYQPFMSSVT